MLDVFVPEHRRCDAIQLEHRRVEAAGASFSR